MIELALVANIVLFLVVSVLLMQRGYMNIYSGLFIYSAFHFMTFVQRPFAVYFFDLRSEFVYMRYFPTEEVFLKTLFVANVGYLCFVAGYILALRGATVAMNFNPP